MARDALKTIFVGTKQTTVTTGLFKGDTLVELEQVQNFIKKGWEPTSVCSTKSSNKAVAAPIYAIDYASGTVRLCTDCGYALVER